MNKYIKGKKKTNIQTNQKFKPPPQKKKPKKQTNK
jgi:hypothetical protein